MENLASFLSDPKVQNILLIIAVMLVIIVITGIIKRWIPKYVKETNQRYRIRKFINYSGYFLFVLLVLIVYSSKLSGFTVFIGVAGAGIAFALQEVIASIAGFLTINFSNFYKVGDRVMLGGIKGDVIDIGVLRTSLMQIGDWVDGDQYNGKIVRIANSFIFKEPVFNYSGDFPFLWDELVIPIKTSSDYYFAKENFTRILHENLEEYAGEAQQYWNKMTEKLMVEDARVYPMVTMMFDQNWITFSLRYVVDYKKRRSTKDKLNAKILDFIRSTGGKVEVATAAMEVRSI